MIGLEGFVLLWMVLLFGGLGCVIIFVQNLAPWTVATAWFVLISLTYTLKGKQYLVIAAGGHGKLGTKLGDYAIAFRSAVIRESAAHMNEPAENS